MTLSHELTVSKIVENHHEAMGLRLPSEPCLGKFLGYHYLFSTAVAFKCLTFPAHKSNASHQQKEWKHVINGSHPGEVRQQKLKEYIQIPNFLPASICFYFSLLHDYQLRITAVKLCSETS